MTDITLDRPRLRAGTELEALTRTFEFDSVDPQQIVTIEGRTGIFTPLTRADPNDPDSTDNLVEVVDVLRRQVVQLQTQNAELKAKLDQLPPRSPDDVAAAIQQSVDTLQTKLSAMTNPVTNFALREFALQSKVRVEVTPVGTLGYHFVQPGDEIEPDALSTLSITLVPVPKPEGDAALPPVTSGPDISVLGFAPGQVEALRSMHVHTVGEFAAVNTRASATAALVGMLAIDRETLGHQVALANLLTIPGVDITRAEVLRAAGIDKIAALATADPGALAEAYAHAAKRRRANDDGWRPDVALAAQWVATAAAIEAHRVG